MTAAAIRSAAYRARRRAETAPDVRALIAQGAQNRSDLDGVARIERHIAKKMHAISCQSKTQTRAKMLGDLADWIVSERELLRRATVIRTGPRTYRLIPNWVPEEMRTAYAMEAREAGELAAAKLVRALKREGGL